jgi:hypothetical protein
VFVDQFQRNGAVLDQRLVFGMATPVLSAEEEQRL